MINPDPRGDIPRRQKRTYHTVSTRIPRTTQTYTCVQTVDKATVAVSNTGNLALAYTFTLNDTDNVSNFQALFDQYRIDAIRLEIVPLQNALQVPTQSTTSFSSLYNVLDYDNASALSGIGAAREYDNLIELAPGESCERVFSPRIAVAAYAGAFTSFANQGPQWIDCSSPSVAHYGLKLLIPAAIAGQTLLQSWQIFAQYYISFRSVL